MRRFAKRLLVALLLLVALGAVYVYGTVTSLDAERVTDDVSMIRGVGGNVGVLRTERGAVVVDTMTFAMQGRRIRELAERIGGGPVQVVINTHYHIDHTHGNPGFPPGTQVVSTRRTRDYLMFFDADYWQGERAGTVPNDTFDDERELRIGGKTLKLVAARGHTGGDLVVLFVEDRVLHTGDLLFNMRYPRIDHAAGGSVREWIATIDRLLELEFDHVIPGHGPVTDRAGLVGFQDFLRELWEQTSEAVAQGRSLDETLATVDLRKDEGYGPGGIPILFELDRDSVVRSAWEEASGEAEAIAVPDSAP